MTELMLAARDLKMYFPTYKGVLFRKQDSLIQAVNGVTLDLFKGETLGLVGESGCGKTTLGRTLIRLYSPTDGHIELCGQDITRLDGAALRKHRSNIQMIFQDPYASLDPRMTVFDIIAEPIRACEKVLARKELEKTVADLMETVGLSSRYIRKYPHEFSGGQRQRIAIARAVAIRPKVILCDEPVSALDVSIQAQILNLLKDLQKEFHLSYLFIAHDISVVRYISDRIAVMYLGKIVELANTEDLFGSPQHPYTKALLSAVPLADPRKERVREQILLHGDLPSPAHPPSGCPFHTRCPWKMDVCTRVVPPNFKAGEGHHAACHLLDEKLMTKQ
ncbi:MAG: ATP-binding cassette domain-containing protein [Deltaproteobacteria bacterium]|nr:ATP-binding cassette domain-containing protein [Deltaproteobacteria bacterium]